MEGFIKLFRKFYEWEWYDNPNTMRVFLHLLLKANYKEKNWRGIDIKRGQCVTSIATLSSELGLSAKQIRGALDNLKRTGEVAIKGTNKYSLVTVLKYSFYQDKAVEVGKQEDKETGIPETNKGQQHNKEIKKEEKNIITTTSGKDRIISFYTENIGQPGPVIVEELNGYLEKTCIEAVEYAIKQAVINGSPNCGYVKGILKKMIAKEVTTAKRVAEYIRTREAMSDTSVVYGKKEDPKKQYIKEGRTYEDWELFDIFEKAD